jgi:DNA-binding transcriptional LysR family regulator
MAMEMLQLRYFYESAQNGSFAKTAEKYMVPTTSVSASVKRLEKELGCPLFDRTCNRILLNEDGMQLLRSLHAVFAELDGTVAQLSSRDAVEREIRILVRGMRRKISDLIVQYNAIYPHTPFRTVFEFGETAYESYDIIIDERNDIYPEYERFLLYSMELGFKCAASDPLCGKELTLKQLSGRKFVSMGEDSNLHRILIRACARAGFTPDIAVACNDIECYEKFIASGMGIAVGRKKETPQDIAFLNVTDFNERYTVYAYYKKAACYGSVRRFLDFLKNHSL